jgi:hypothetical protein
MRRTLPLVLLVFAVLGCLTVAGGILDAGYTPSDLDGSANARPEPVASLQHALLLLRRPLDYDRALLHRPRPPSPGQWSDSRVLLTRRVTRGYSCWMRGRIPQPRRNASATQTSLSAYDPARII